MTDRIEQAAAQLLRKTRQNQPPVDVDRIAKSLGIRIEHTELDGECSGVLVRKENGSAVIGVNWSHHENRQRFTIAHEIGHFLLHKGGTYVDKGTYARYRDEQSGSGTISEERQANRFAAALLMPTTWIRALFDSRPFDPADDAALTNLATTFAVSSHAMGIRLANLGLLKL